RLRRQVEADGDGDHLVELEGLVLLVDLPVGEVPVRPRATGVEPGPVPVERQGAILDPERNPVAGEEREADRGGGAILDARGERERGGAGADGLSRRTAVAPLLDAGEGPARGGVEVGVDEDLVEDGQLAAE